MITASTDQQKSRWAPLLNPCGAFLADLASAARPHLARISVRSRSHLGTISRLVEDRASEAGLVESRLEKLRPGQVGAVEDRTHRLGHLR